jgi:prevent-host-death family protein
MTVVNVTQVRTQLSDIIARVKSGEELVVVQNSQPIFSIQPYLKKQKAQPKKLNLKSHLPIQPTTSNDYSFSADSEELSPAPTKVRTPLRVQKA